MILNSTETSHIPLLKRLSNNALRISYFLDNEMWKKTIIFVLLKNFKIVSYKSIYNVKTLSLFIHQEFAREPNICVVRVTSTEGFKRFYQHLDIPIDSNIFIVTGNISKNVSVYDVYRAAPHTEMR